MSSVIEAHGLLGVGLQAPVETATLHNLLISFELFNPAKQACADFETTVNGNTVRLMGIQTEYDGSKAFCDGYISGVLENSVVTITVSHTFYGLVSFSGIRTVNTSSTLREVEGYGFTVFMMVPFQ